MARRPPTEISDYLDILLRRKWWIVIPAISVTALVLLIGLKIPKTYRSQAVVLVDPQKVPEQYIRTAVGSTVASRLHLITQEIMSRTRLQKLIDQFGLYRDMKGNKTQEEIIDAMRKDIEIDVDLERASREKAAGAFRIAFMGKDPQVVQQVTAQLTSMFIEENLKFREQQAEGTDEFIDAELEKARVKLLEQENKIKAFKAKYMGRLPEQQNTNLSLISQYQSLLQANTEALSRLQQQKSYIESMLQAAKANQVSLGGPSKSDVEMQLDAARVELTNLLQTYKDSHPDVIKARKRISVLESQLKPTTAASTATPEGSTDSVQARTQLKLIDQEIARRNQMQSDIERKIRNVQSGLETLPAIEAEFMDINRDYTTTNGYYQQLLEKKNASGTAAELERRAKGEQFRILDPATIPEKPYKPDMLQLNVLGILAGVLIGGAFGAVMELRDSSVHTERDLTYYTSLPVLGAVPVVYTRDTLEKAKKKLRVAIMAGGAAGALGLIAVVIVLIQKGVFSRIF